MQEYKDLEGYGIIGNLDTCALIGDDGSIDWCCFPHIESPSVFGAILDRRNGGRFSINPSGSYNSSQKYAADTNVLETHFVSNTGTAVLIDFMPIKAAGSKDGETHQVIYRKLTCTRGGMNFESEFSPRFDYARGTTRLLPVSGGIEAHSSRRELFLQSGVDFRINGSTAETRFDVSEGETRWFVLQYSRADEKSPAVCEEELARTLGYWSGWVHDVPADVSLFSGPWRNLVVRSGLVLKLLAHEEAGAICAAPTTSLPEWIGGTRNWDYRYTWIRDASFTVQALYNIGHYEEARRHLEWFIDICRRYQDPSQIQIMYGMHGETDLREVELDHLEGYRKSRPVRIGNGAAKQRQLDIFGELINAVYETGRYGGGLPEGELEFVMRIVDHVCEVWDTTDSGIWEVRGGPRHFVYSKLMCWVALDRGIRIAERRNYDAQFGKWRSVRDEIKRTIIEKGFDPGLGSFVQSFGSATLDATGLMIPIMEFLPPDDPHVRGTIDAVLKHLTTPSGLVYRYLGEDGLPGKEGTFLLCSFWLVKALAISGRLNEAEEILNKVARYAGSTGLLSEEVNPETGKQLGNLPQAFSHIGLINSVLYLEHARGKSHAGPTPTGAKERAEIR